MKNNILKRLALKAKNRILGKNIYDGACVKIVQNNETEFYQKAKEVFLKSEQNNLYNPIKMLMDKKVLIKLDARGREKYLLETVEKYLKARQQFSREEFC